MTMSDTLRWITIIVFLLAGAALVYTGHVTGDQWLTTIGGILAGGAGKSAFPQAK